MVKKVTVKVKTRKKKLLTKWPRGTFIVGGERHIEDMHGKRRQTGVNPQALADITGIRVISPADAANIRRIEREKGLSGREYGRLGVPRKLRKKAKQARLTRREAEEFGAFTTDGDPREMNPQQKRLVTQAHKKLGLTPPQWF